MNNGSDDTPKESPKASPVMSVIAGDKPSKAPTKNTATPPNLMAVETSSTGDNSASEEPRSGNDDHDTRQQLSRLRQEHRDLDAAIDALYETGRSDHLQIQRLKKRKLVLKDRIGELEDQLLPDIIA